MIFYLKANYKFIDIETGQDRTPGECFSTENEARVRSGIQRGYFALERIYPNKTTAENRELKTVFFIGEFANIGGIETALTNASEWFAKENLTLIGRNVDFEGALRFAKNHTVIIDNGSDNYACDTAIYMSFDSPELFRWRVNAKKRYFIVHADWATLKKYDKWKSYQIDEGSFDKVIAVSKTAKKGLLTAFDNPVKSVVVQNPPAKELPPRTLTILTLSRGTREKGMERIYLAAKKLQKAGLPFLWIVAGTQCQYDTFRSLQTIPSIVFLPPSWQNQSLIKSVDYVAQLSESESYCYSIHDALAAGTPVIATRIPEFEKIVEPGKNGYLTDLELRDFDAKTIYENIPKFTPAKEKLDPKWKKLLNGEL